jgi:hypothetical protein
MPELILRATQTRGGSAEAQQIRIAYFAETGSQRIKLEILESYEAHQRLWF